MNPNHLAVKTNLNNDRHAIPLSNSPNKLGSNIQMTSASKVNPDYNNLSNFNSMNFS